MPRPRRYAPPDSVLHLVNRGNDRKSLFASTGEYAEFLDLMQLAKEVAEIRIVAYCLMPNHWHMVVWPCAPHSVSTFCHRLATTHAIRHRRSSHTLGQGHLYQDRYHSFAVESERQYLQVLRYVEANPVRAGLIAAAQDWPWSSLHERCGVDRGLTDPGPIPLPAGWPTLVDEALPRAELDTLRAHLARTKPYDLRLRRRRVAETASDLA